MIDRALLGLAAAPFGACFGSYAASAGLRAARGEQSAAGRSRCDSCGVSLGFSRTVPILSFLLLRGRCEVCRAKIAWSHLAGEVAGALILASAFGLAPATRAAPMAALGLVLVATSVQDAMVQRLSDGLTLAAAVFAIWLAAERSASDLIVGFAVAATAFCLLQLLRKGFIAATGRQGLGFGDVKLIAALAIWLGLATPWAVGGAAAGGLALVAVLRPASRRLSFGPMLSVSAWLVGASVEAGVWPSMA